MLDGNRIGVPSHLHNLSVCWYVNHSDRPNTKAGDDGRFRALRRIRRGEELTADYRTFSDEEPQFGPKRVVRRRTPKRARTKGGHDAARPK